MTAILTWGQVASDLDFHAVEINKMTGATCHAYFNCKECPGSNFNMVSI